MKKLSESTSAYLKAVSLALSCSGREKKRVITLLTESVHNAALENPDITQDELVSRFGTPEEVAEAALDAYPQTGSNQCWRRKLCVIAVACLLICAIAITARQVHLYKLDNEFYSGHNEETIYGQGENETAEELEQRMQELRQQEITNGAIFYSD